MTPKQKLVLDFIKTYVEIKGFAPSYANIATGLSLKSKSNIHRIVHELRKQGLLDVKPHLFRSITVKERTLDEVASL
jgi:repressor LexA